VGVIAMSEEKIVEILKKTIEILDMDDDELARYMEEHNLPVSATSNESSRRGLVAGKLTFMLQRIEERGVRDE
jgi:hypothetical protein